MTLQAFVDLHNSTRYIPYPDRKKWRNLISERNYIADWMMGTSDKTRFSGGVGIEFRDMVNLGGPNNRGTAKTLVPGVPQDLNIIQKTKTRKQGWKFIADNETVSEQELKLTSGAPAEDQLLDFMALSEERFAGSLVNKWEDTWIALPDQDTMEGVGKEPMSMFAYITEKAGGIHNNWGGTSIGGYTTAEVPKWDNKRVTYAEVTTGGTGRMLSQALAQAIRYARTPTMPLGFGNSERQAIPGIGAVGCSDHGYRQYEYGVIEQSNDPFRAMQSQDLVPGNLKVKGLDFLVWDGFERAEVYEGAATAASGTYYTEDHADTTVVGPRFYGLNRELMHPMVHSEHYMQKLPLRTVANMPYDYVMWRSLWTNLICKDRSGLFVVSPSVDIAAI